MKKMSPRTAGNLSARTAFCLVVLVVAAFCLVACSGDEVQYVSPEGYALSGKITLDGEGLGGVEILVNGEKTAVSDDNGVFSLTGLSYGDEVAFLADGYAFSPASYTVKGTVNDLGVRASAVVVPPAEDDPETPDDPEDEDGQDGDDTQDEDPVLEKLPSPSVTVTVSRDSAVATVLMDGRAAAFTFSFRDGSAATVGLSETSFVLDGHTFAVTRGERGGNILLSVDISPLKCAEGAAYTLVFAVSAQGFLPSDEVRAEAVFPPVAPTIPTVTFDPDSTVLSWATENAPEGCTFAVYADGVLVCNTSSTEFDAGATLPAGEYTFVVVLLSDAIPAAVSPEVTAVLP